MVWQAYKHVKANKGSSGIDGMSWEYLEKNSKRELYKLWNRLTSGSYFAKAVKQVEIAKKDGGNRKLGIPTLLDRIAQEVARMHLEEKVEPKFHKHSFGYRPKRSCHDAVIKSRNNSSYLDYVIDLDIQSFFDTIDHALLLKAVKHYCKDKWILMYVERWLKSGILVKQNHIPSLQGTPQGGVISPLLANIYLHVVFDQWMNNKYPEKPFERYADDIVVHCKTEKQAKFMLRKITERFAQCKLKVHPEKTKIVYLGKEPKVEYSKSYDFLGFSIHACASKEKGKIKRMVNTYVSKKSKKSILEKFKALEIHKRRKPLELIAKELNPVIRGIINYYHKFWDGHMFSIWHQLNTRLLKWVKWEKGLYKKAAVKWLRTQYKQRPNLFLHWLLVHP